MICRICGGTTRPLLKLGTMPPANGLLDSRDQRPQEFPLVLEQCACGNFQVGYCVDLETLFGNYTYYTPRSPSLTKHYSDLRAWLAAGGHLTEESSVLEIGSNAGHLLESLKPHVHSVLGVDPASSIAREATENGIPTISEFFGVEVARELEPVDMVIARHCLAHNADPYKILDGVLQVLKPNGSLVIENAYAQAMFENNDWTQVYHEHFFYYTLRSLRTMLEKRGLVICDLQFVDIHGGSFVAVAKRAGLALPLPLKMIFIDEETNIKNGMAERFATAARTAQVKIREAVKRFDTVYAYGATAKGATLLNACGLTYRQIPFCADGTPTKRGRFIPKAGVEIVSEEWALANPPDAFLLTAWNYQDEIIAKVRAKLPDMKFIVPIPRVTAI